jgi:DNA polymerase-1
LFGDLDINFDSPIQVKTTLEKIVGFKLKNTDAKYLGQFEHPGIGALLEYREWNKKITTYGSCFLDAVHSVTNRIHAKYLQLGTDSGRSSCTAPNMQNIPKEDEYRKPFCAQLPNWKIISADFANQELRVLAYLSKEPAFMKCIEDGLDLHRMVGSILLNKPYEDITDEERVRAKTLNFGK